MENIYRSLTPPVLVPEGLSLHQFLTAYNPDVAPREKVILEDLGPPFRKLTYGGLRDQASIGAAALIHRYGLKPGDTVMVYATNSVDHALLAHSIMWAGCVLAGVNIAWAGAELGHAISTADPKVIACDSQLKDRVRGGLEKAKNLKHTPHVLEIGDSQDAFPQSFVYQPPTGVTPMPPFDLTGEDSRKAQCLILFSSGTTGNAKAVLLSHANMIAYISSSRATDPWLANSSMREVFFAPIAHIIGVVGVLMLPAYIGSSVTIMRQFELTEFIRACAETKATTMKTVPSIAVAFAQHPLAQKVDLSRISFITCAGATLRPAVVQKLQTILKGVHFVQAYGLSEAIISNLPYDRSVDKTGSVGRLLAGCEIRIVDEDLRDVKPGQPGEVLTRGPSVFMGYKNNEEATREIFHDGWMRTGDVLHIDEDEFLWFHERRKELIKVKGNQVAPSELEGVIGSHPKVIEAAVCGYFDDERQTEWPIGYVVLAPSVPADGRREALGEIHAWVNGQVATYKQLRGGLHHIDALPKNPTGKLQRNRLPIKLAEQRGVKM